MSQSQRSASVRGVPMDIFSMFTSGWNCKHHQQVRSLSLQDPEPETCDCCFPTTDRSGHRHDVEARGPLDRSAWQSLSWWLIAWWNSMVEQQERWQYRVSRRWTGNARYSGVRGDGG